MGGTLWGHGFGGTTSTRKILDSSRHAKRMKERKGQLQDSDNTRKHGKRNWNNCSYKMHFLV
jgi:hypothetical protein